MSNGSKYYVLVAMRKISRKRLEEIPLEVSMACTESSFCSKRAKCQPKGFLVQDEGFHHSYGFDSFGSCNMLSVKKILYCHQQN